MFGLNKYAAKPGVLSDSAAGMCVAAFGEKTEAKKKRERRRRWWNEME